MDADAELEYRRALSVTQQWQGMWQQTRNQRDMDTALICGRIARERFQRLQAERVAQRDYRELIAIERAAETASVFEEIRNSVAECRRLFEQIDQASIRQGVAY